MPKLELTSQQRSALRAAAHPLHPVVLIGDRGLTAAVLEEIDRTLAAHELIKIRVAGAERDERDAMLTEICETLSCAAVHHLGKTLIIYRPDLLAQQAAQAAENATRAVRRKSEPYVPKKQAAQPRATGPASQRAAGANRADQAQDPAAGAAKSRMAASRGAGKPARNSRAEAGHGIPRRSGGGSALSLRAGARRGRTSRG
ncbi:YhbY family RNA-binding protein [Castellaniella ginsengisoli]|uniref:YhbY family RNA-binding protein n=1 Tax=Castellaniella ginsengisoli TaxID=546114 RepID=A0AB39EUK9_9BURK